MQISKNAHAAIVPAFLREFERLMDAWHRDNEQLAITLTPYHSFDRVVLSHIVYSGAQSKIVAAVRIHFIDVTEQTPNSVLLKGRMGEQDMPVRQFHLKGNLSGLEMGMKEFASHLLDFFANGRWPPSDGWMSSANVQTSEVSG